ncbi:MAG: HAMP domain-containing sensor histidine kinase [Bifidobacterium sp.]|nr:HAMP domain-containing sensor histidine kinase [Bifidobacterium sp.]
MAADRTREGRPRRKGYRSGSVRLAVLFTLRVFALFVVALLLSMVAMRLLYHVGFFRGAGPQVPLFVLCVTSVVMGVGLSRIAGGDILDAVTKASEAAERVARGDFDVRLDVRSRAREVNTLTDNFNRMGAELEQSQMLSEDFVTNVSHEFKTPLASIEGYATLLQDPTLDDARRQDYVARILQASRRLTDMTGSILELSRLERQELTLRREPFSLDEQLRECILEQEDAWTRKGIELDVDLDELEVDGNADLLARVWQNLIGNAVKFTPEGGHIAVSLTQAFGAGGAEAVVRVTDDGPGMDEAQRNRVFDKFYQGDTSHTGQGAGLGLALAREVVELHGGTIAVRSAPGKGASFAVTLPLEEPSA